MELCKQRMIDSYRNVSFRGEERGESDYKHYSEMLEKDLALLGENSGKYREKFISKVMDIYASKARTASAMIVGPARFKVTTKANESEQRKTEHFTYWRERYFKLVNRVRTKPPEEMNDLHKKELERLEALKEKRKAEGFKARDYRIVNLNARIRYYKEMIESNERRMNLIENFKEVEIKGGRIYASDNRIIVEHLEKPDRNVIDLVKSHGFKYSPRTKTWVRKFTENAIFSTKQLYRKLKEMDSGTQD